MMMMMTLVLSMNLQTPVRQQTIAALVSIVLWKNITICYVLRIVVIIGVIAIHSAYDRHS